MSITSNLDKLHSRARKNKWLRYFARFNRFALAAGFLPSGLQKVLGERFTDLSVHHPMGNYLEAFYHTGFYYTFVGLMQVTAAILLLFSRTATLGAVIYFPIILNICILSFAVRFDGSMVTSPLMVLANLFLLCWDYHKLKFIIPFNKPYTIKALSKKNEISSKFPTIFFTAVIVTFFIMVMLFSHGYKILPRNTYSDCKGQCASKENPDGCFNFCDCIHKNGNSLNKCLDEYKKTIEDIIRKD